MTIDARKSGNEPTKPWPVGGFFVSCLTKTQNRDESARGLERMPSYQQHRENQSGGYFMFSACAFIRAMPVAVLIAGSGAATAFAGPIEERQALMREDGKAGQELFKMFKGEASYDAATV